MRRILFLLLLPALLYAAGVTINETNTDTIDKIVFAWTSDSTGAVTGTTTARYTGAVGRVIFDPGAPAPSDNYDVAIYDQNSYDILKSRGYNKDSLVTSQIDSMFSAVANSKLMLVVVNAGDSTSGVVTLYIIPTTSDESISSVSDTTGLNMLGKLYYYTGDSTLYIGTGTGLSQIATGTGDIASVTAGWGLSGGGNSGAVSLAVDTSEVATQYDLATVQVDNININDGTIANVDIDSNAAIAGSKLADNGITYAKLDTAAAGFVDVRKFGAAGDGVTDDATAISNAITSAAGNVVYFPSGTYYVGSNISVATDLNLIGNGAVLDGSGSNSITFASGCSSVSVSGIKFNDFGNSLVIDTDIAKLDLDSCVFDSCLSALYQDDADTALAVSNVQIKNNRITNGSDGIRLRGVHNNNIQITKNYIYNLQSATGPVAVQVGSDVSYRDAAYNVVVSDNIIKTIKNTDVTGHETHAIYVFGSRVVISQNNIEDVDATQTSVLSGVEGIYTKARWCTINANTLIDAGYTEGMIVVKGTTREDSISTTNHMGYSVVISNNVLVNTYDYHIAASGVSNGGWYSSGLNVQAEDCLVIGNHIEGMTKYGLYSPVSGANVEWENLSIKENVFSRTRGNSAIYMDSHYDKLDISGNNILNILDEKDKYRATAIYLGRTNRHLKRVTVKNNKYVLEAGTQTTSTNTGITIAAKDSVVNDIVLDNNQFDFSEVSSLVTRCFYFNGNSTNTVIDSSIIRNNVAIGADYFYQESGTQKPDLQNNMLNGSSYSGDIMSYNYDTMCVGFKSIDVDSATVGTGGIWQRNWFYNAADSSVAMVFYNTTLARVDTVFMRQP